MTFLCQKDMQLQAANHLGKYPHHFSFKRTRDCLPLIWQGQELISFRWPKLWNMEKSLANEIGFGSVRLSNSATRLKRYLVINLCSLSSHQKCHLAERSLTEFLCVRCAPKSTACGDRHDLPRCAHQLSVSTMQKFTSTESFLMLIKVHVDFFSFSNICHQYIHVHNRYIPLEVSKE